jgi:medium-chain acyl-[acyl-carrier-protein] hydrolase
MPAAGASVFRSWPADLPDDVALHAIQLPGRGNRIGERAFTDMAALVAALAAALSPQLTRPFAFFGHSLGAVLCFEVARWLRRHGRPLPLCLVVAGRRAPQMPYTEPAIHTRSDEELVAWLATMNATHPEILADPEMRDLVLPAVRADSTVVDNYAYVDEPPLPCPITAIGGRSDLEVDEGRLEGWRTQTTGPFSAHVLEGDHFFIHSEREAVLALLRQCLHTVAGRGA